jgi:acetyl-CoA acetyltransferase
MRSAAWCNQDLFFLADALRHGGMSYAAVAGFLGRERGEVREEAKRLGVKSRHLASRAPKRNRSTIFKRAPRAHRH